MRRREFLASVLAGAGAVLVPPGGAAEARVQAPAGRDVARAGPARRIRLVAAPGEVDVGAGRPYRTWLYNGQFPGPEIRVTQGERVRIAVENLLPEGTTVHWHGIPVPNAMDGVPGVTQDPIRPGETFLYEFVADVPGTYLYHAHVGLQIDRGLIAPFIVEERGPSVDCDREHTLILDDFLPGEPAPLGGRAGAARPGRRMGRGMRGGMMGGQTPPYAALLVNGRLRDDPPVFETRRGERVRLRLANPSGATTCRFAIAGHRLDVVATDGRPVRPVRVDSLLIGMGERYDVVVEASNPGVWTMMAAGVDARLPPARALLRYRDAAAARPRADAMPEGLVRGRVLELDDLRALDELDRRTPDCTIDLTLSGGMMSTAWTIGGQAYPDADPLDVHEGERVRVRLLNHSMMRHPMHLHGHFFRTGEALKDTVVVPPRMGRITFDFTADNPGRWFFHCHNIYHMEAGMARVFRYV